MNNYVIEKLKEGRANAKLKQSDVALKIGIKPNTVSNYENGVSEPDIDTFCSLCDIYGLNPADILNEAYGLSVQGSNFTIKPSEIKHIEKYRLLDDSGKKHINYELDRELERTTQAQGAAGTIEHLQQQLAIRPIPPHFFAYYGRIAAAGTSVEFSDIAAGVRTYPENEINKNADYVIGVSGDSMEPEYFNGDIVYVQKTDHIETGDIGIFQKGNNIYIKKAGENGLISLNPNYPPLTADDDRIIVLGKVLGKAEN